MKSAVGIALVAGGLALASAPGHAQAAHNDFLAVGDTAPDIQVTGSTRYGTLKDPVSLSDFRGQTVVLAFYFKARTPG